MPQKTAQSKAKTHDTARARAENTSHLRTAPPTVSGRWLLSAIAGVMTSAALCVWLVLCLLFWQGSWQLLYHPSSTVAKTPASAGLPFDPISFATTGAGTPQLTGWWIPAAQDSRYSRYTVLYLHGQDGNLDNAVSTVAELHKEGVNVFAFDYRGYGQSKFARPSEAHWAEDANWALDYLTNTRHIDPKNIVVYGKFLGANLALEVAAAHSELAGVVVKWTYPDPAAIIFGDSRARLVPAHLLVRDRYDIVAAGRQIRVPTLWFEFDIPPSHQAFGEPAAYHEISSRKTLVWLTKSHNSDSDLSADFTRWLDDVGHNP